MTRIDKVREKIAQGDLVKGVFITMADSVSSEMAGYCGYDYVWIDAEHGALDRQEILFHIRAAQGSGCCAFVRVRAVEPSIVKAILDMGPDGIIFPFCDSADIARTAIAACAYPDSPLHGIRGQGPVRAIRYGLDDEATYLKEAYSKVWKILQIETIEGYRNVSDIIKVPGIDSLFIGAADLGRSIAGCEDHYQLEEVYDDICKQVRGANIVLGAAIGPTKDDAVRVKQKGVQWVVFGQDSRILAEGLRSNLAAVGQA
ncbi:HpcH/HpaI aldolase family protein [Sphaerochaeta globosa]|uniref:HpcH/HpaI aldolase n=1 Tax=Sphaerochaeta globosa (strain ATCC BAA-1886 / DSM 22777 / Buddy) TaxID=158189 RepID=F0RU94_SPHGB|nr:aldolase/citrate lyase family protein [Sphaerochaeta globosa]ADY12180.1 HpcH/HpaI aldolase [Sphaerochaeta globosa str. Buddy]